jgi:hypothetical protein
VEDSHDFDRILHRTIHQEVTSAATVPRDVQCAKTRHDFISGLRACNIGTPGQFSNRLNQGLPVNARLSRAKILGGPFDNVRKVDLCGGAETETPFPFGHGILFGCSGDDLLREVIQIGLQVFDCRKLVEFASIQRADTDARRRS